MKSTICPLERVEDRGKYFSELKSRWVLPMHETSQVETITTGPGGQTDVTVTMHV